MTLPETGENLPNIQAESQQQVPETKEAEQRELDKAFAEFTSLESSGVRNPDEIFELKVSLENSSQEEIKALEAQLTELGVPSLSDESKSKILSNNIDGAIALEQRKADKHAALLEVLTAAGKIEGKNILAEGLDKDPRLQSIFEEQSLKYLKTKDAVWFNKQFNGQVSEAGYLLDKQGNVTNFLPSQNIDSGFEEVQNAAQLEFARQFPEDAKIYAAKEKVRVYENPSDDPALKKVEAAIAERVRKDIEESRSGKWGTLLQDEANRLDVAGAQERARTHAAMKEWGNFVLAYPEKAQAYSASFKPIERALNAQVLREQKEISQKARRAREGEQRLAKSTISLNGLEVQSVAGEEQGAQGAEILDQDSRGSQSQNTVVNEQAELSPEERQRLMEEVKGVYADVYFARKTTLANDLLLASHGVNPDTEEQFFEKVDGTVGQFFDAHGIAKTDQLTKLIQLLEKGIDHSRSFSTAPFEVPDDVRMAGSVVGTAGGTAYKDGMAVVTSNYGKNLVTDGIGHVFINDLYSDMKQPLARLFPKYKIHLLSEQKQVLETEYKLATKK